MEVFMAGLGILVSVLNFILASLIVYFGYKAHKQGAGKVTTYLIAAFILFAFSHLQFLIIDIFGLTNIVAPFTSALKWISLVIFTRIIAYALVAFALFAAVKKNKEQKSDQENKKDD